MMRRFRSSSALTARFFLVLLVALLPLIGAALWNTVLLRRNELAAAQAAALRVARQAAFLHQHVVDGSGRVLMNLARTPGVMLADAGGRPGVLTAASGAHAAYTRIGMAGSEGRVIAFAGQEPRWVDVADRRFFRQALGARELVGADFEADPVTGETSVTLAYPVTTGSGEVEYVLFAVVDFGWFKEFASAAGLPPGSRVSVLDETGTVVADERGASRARRAALPGAATRALAGRPASGAALLSEDGKRVFALERLRASSSARPMFVAVDMPTPSTHGDKAMLLTLAGMVTAGILLLGATRIGLDLTFTRPVRALTATALRLGRGDLAARAGMAGGPEELQKLAMAFDQMAGAIERRDRGIRRDKDVLADRERGLRTVLDEIERRVIQRTAELLQANKALQIEIGDRIRVEETLRKFSRAIEQTGDSVFVTDANGIIEYVNPSFEQQTGYAADEVLGHTPRVVKSGVHDQQYYEGMWQHLLNGGVTRVVLVNRRKDGRLYDEMQTISPVRDSDGKITHFVSTGRDITKHRRQDEAMRRLTERLEQEASRIAGALHDEAGQFLTVAHTTLAQLAMELPAGSRERLQDVRDNLDKVEDQLRRLSHELRPRILDDLGLTAAVEFVADGVSKRSGLTVHVQSSVDGRFPSLVETAIYRMAQEGLTNVARHARAREAWVILSSEPGGVRCVVRDNGEGFDVDEVMSRRGNPSLGLVGLQDRVTAVGGVLEVHSTPGIGTELVATIPLES